ncbi:PupR/FecR-like anti-sigma factor protein [Azotobacter vinelandii CA]|uniref:PupR/FecR-like anti-sigma factor protein n=2 Tax=Azotobacter vinelandii TaxID=354 RepID=C1DGN9_AZOVD|nr:FecR domain-containing protein [Azotobacter vinelandii]ACO80535.1 PupR/FecR-like anti-sigma factor protein [Azotobacter vinelandii DJ]AGK15963.1 PupR/FecR-like anti-sigma factor protein [Azotobacter vinelandii CA]AGK21985.1 PupR/FecR-like anti-sigma factor protein [Azotobacter vinelandii CA6]SFX36500.1 FecR family protein [Azotobacter vinelandii]GLK58577.1 anti-sigma factor FoxR [Azotobacter vinelandii]
MSRTPQEPLPEAVIEQAIDWAVRLTYGEADASTRSAFQVWHEASEQHRQAWQRVQSLQGRFAGVPADLAMQALSKLPKVHLRRRQLGKLTLLLGALGATTWGAGEVTPWQRLLADHSTAIGERRRWRLADGSQLDLNTDSAVSLHFDSEQRLLRLLRGELHLISGSDTGQFAERPLRVQTRDGLLEALGTRFSVRLDEQATRLAVEEGAVSLRPADGSELRIAGAGQQWLLNSGLALRLPQSHSAPNGWLDGQLIARELPLEELLAELSRHRHGYLGCDPAIARRPISGNFQLSDIDATLDFIARSHDLRLYRLTRYWVRLGAT